MTKYLLWGLFSASTLQATVNNINITGAAGIANETGSSLALDSIIRVGTFNDTTTTTTRLSDAAIVNLLTGTQAQVRANLDALFAANKVTLWGSTTVGTVFGSSPIAVLSKSNTSVFAGNPIYILVCNTTSITTATEIGIFTYLTGGGSRTAFPSISSLSTLTLQFDGTNMRPCLGSIGADGKYRLATIGTGYGITSSEAATATRNKTFSYFTVANNGATSFGATGLPTGLGINSATGQITGIPTAVAGTYFITLTATGPLGARTGSLFLTLSNPALGTPSITSSLANQQAWVGVPYVSYATTADNSPTSYSASGLPAGLTCDANTGVISGIPIPAEAGFFYVTLNATNSTGTGSASFLLIVSNPYINRIEKTFGQNVLSSTTAPEVLPLGFVPTYYYISSGSLPAGLSINSATGIISGIPTSSGTTSFQIGASANGANAFGDAVITVTQTQFNLNVAYDSLKGTITISPNTTTYSFGSSVQLQAAGLPGYVFSGWSGDILANTPNVSLTMDANKVITANFGQDIGDNDADGLSNYQEIVTYGTNPNKKDTNSDGIEDGQAVAMGYIPTFNFSALISYLQSHPPTGLYTATQMQAMAIGDIVLTKNANGSFTLNYDIEQSSDLQSWLPYQSFALPLTNLPPDKAFIRFKAKQ